mmetsp:Transcript_1213/g.3829  ORF Transcript_1213/g.3829 Transcript_1213/m.3829 type:complete len:241 (-) Transcript_1213:60-782(-)
MDTLLLSTPHLRAASSATVLCLLEVLPDGGHEHGQQHVREGGHHLQQRAARDALVPRQLLERMLAVQHRPQLLHQLPCDQPLRLDGRTGDLGDGEEARLQLVDHAPLPEENGRLHQPPRGHASRAGEVAETARLGEEGEGGEERQGRPRAKGRRVLGSNLRVGVRRRVGPQSEERLLRQRESDARVAPLGEVAGEEVESVEREAGLEVQLREGASRRQLAHEADQQRRAVRRQRGERILA